MSNEFLETLAREISEFEGLNNSWPQDWEYEQVDARIEEHSSVLDAAQSKGLTKIGAGDFRTVFAVQPDNQFGFDSNTVLKISKYNGTEQNAEAVNIYQDLCEGAKNCTARILDYHPNKLWILQQKGGSAKPGDGRRVAEKLAKYDRYVGDIRDENCCRINGEAVLADLGLLR